MTHTEHQDAIREHKITLLETQQYGLFEEPPEAFYTWDILSQVRYIDKHGEWLA